MDNPNNIEELFRSLEHFSEEPAEKVWTRLERTFAQKKREGTLWLFTDVCIVGTLLLLSIWGPAAKNSGLNAKQTSAALGNTQVQSFSAQEIATTSTHNVRVEFNEYNAANNSRKNTHVVVVDEKVKSGQKTIDHRNSATSIGFTGKHEPTIELPERLTNLSYLNGINEGKLKIENLTPYFKTYQLPVLLRPVKLSNQWNTQYLLFSEFYTGNTEFKRVEGLKRPLSAIGMSVGLLKQLKINQTVSLFGGLGYELQNSNGSYTYKQLVEQQKNVLVINSTNNIKSYYYNDTVVVQQTSRVNVLRQSVKIPVGVNFTFNKWVVSPQFNVWVSAQYRIPVSGEISSNGPLFKMAPASVLTGGQLSLSRTIDWGNRNFQAGLFVSLAGNKQVTQKQAGIRTTLSF